MTTNQLIQKLIIAVQNESYADYEIIKFDLEKRYILLQNKKNPNNKVEINL